MRFFRKSATTLTIGAVVIATSPLFPTAASAASAEMAVTDIHQAKPPTLGLSMQVVAHQDDDLFFMNPDIDQVISSGHASVTVYVTAGQISGDGATDQERARNRQRGIQNAYAVMANVADADADTQQEWTGQAVTFAGKVVEQYALRERPDVRLVFMNLRDAALGGVDGGGSDDTVVPAGGLVEKSWHYARADVVSVIRAMMEAWAPTVLRAMDPIPDTRAGYASDHADHVASARLAADAAAGYVRPLYEVNYRVYNIGDVPANLEPADVKRKTEIVDEYYRYDRAFKSGGSGDKWLSRMYYRWSRGTHWVGQNADGRPQAFVVRGGSVVTYAQAASGGWSGPVALANAGGPLTPGLAVGRDAGGRLMVFGRRLSDHHIVVARQDRPGGAFGEIWADLGNPKPATGRESQDQVGTPVVAANEDGRLQVFVKNTSGGVSTRVQGPDGSWTGAWTSLGGSDVQDGLSAVTGSDGQISVFASTRDKILYWNQSSPNGDFVLNRFLPGGQPASPPRALVGEDGKIDVAYRQPGTGHMMLAHQIRAGGSFQSPPVDLGGQGGVGEPGMTLSRQDSTERVMIFQRNRNAGVSLLPQVRPNAGFGAWTDLGGVVLEYPAAVTDGASRAVVFVIGGNGVFVRRQTAAGADKPWIDWESLGF